MLKWPWRRATPAPPSASAPAAPAASADDLMRTAFRLDEAGDIDAAAELYRRILAIDPNYADAHYLLGVVARRRNQPDEALRRFHEAIRCNDREFFFHKALGDLHLALGRWREAVPPLEQATGLAPADVDAWNKLGCAYAEGRRLADAQRCFERARVLAPQQPDILNNLASALRDTARVDEALEVYATLKDLAPEHPDVWSNYLLTLNFSTRHTRAQVYEAHLAYDAALGSGRHGVPVRRAPRPQPDRLLKIAYFSPDLRTHAVATFLEPVLRHHDRSRFHVTCYHLHPAADAVTARLRTRVDAWVDAAQADDDTLAQRIEDDAIDLLVDLAGHTGWNRLPVLARKPAPVQATWLGYLNTTGLRAIDYRITDAVADPVGVADAFHVETLVRLPHAAWCFGEPPAEPAVAPLPALVRGAVCFGSLNNAAKLSRDVLDLWAGVLHAVPGAVLLIVGVEDEQARGIREHFGAAGIAAARLEFSPRLPLPQFRQLHERIDIALDTYPYSGATTTLESLWMGVPTLTLAGESTLSRSSLSILTTLGLPDWAAHGTDEFLATAAAKAGDLASLARLRAALRDRLRTSPLMDAPAFTRTLEAQYRHMWQRHCALADGAPSTGSRDGTAALRDESGQPGH